MLFPFLVILPGMIAMAAGSQAAAPIGYAQQQQRAEVGQTGTARTAEAGNDASTATVGRRLIPPKVDEHRRSPCAAPTATSRSTTTWPSR